MLPGNSHITLEKICEWLEMKYVARKLTYHPREDMWMVRDEICCPETLTYHPREDMWKVRDEICCPETHISP